MRKYLVLASALLMMSSFSSTALAWSKKDTLWQTSYLALHAIDWGQTLDIARQCKSGAYLETNPVIGECPSSQWVNTYFLGTALLHVGISRVLPQKYRRMFQAGTIGMQMGVVQNNANIGLNVRF